ncbi:hypothetical protein AGMMS49921_11360 [Endomicrobiia bacterium]|nr:hypothetical protein AGMMS49921_11360 [Endomicrobiia bacterium]
MLGKAVGLKIDLEKELEPFFLDLSPEIVEVTISDLKETLGDVVMLNEELLRGVSSSSSSSFSSSDDDSSSSSSSFCSSFVPEDCSWLDGVQKELQELAKW